MKTPVIGYGLILATLLVVMFCVITQEGQAQISSAAPHHVYRLQYSYNGRVWHDLSTIKDGDLAQNVRYLDKGRGMPSLRYWYSYLDEDGLRRVQYIPLTISEAP